MVGVRGKTKLYTLLSREKYLIDMLFPQLMLQICQVKLCHLLNLVSFASANHDTVAFH